MKIIRVLPQKTSCTPDDDMVFIGEPPGLIIPEHDEIHISCTFTWDRPYCEYLKDQWEMWTDKPVKLGGVAYGSPCDTFTPGLYVKQGIIFTSRGCNNSCAWCSVSKREGKLRELPIVEGNIIQDNNFLQCSVDHKDKVFKMLKTQKQICFKGGLQSNLINNHFIKNIEQLSIKELWLACDSEMDFPLALNAIARLVDEGYTRHQIRCYALIGIRAMDIDEYVLRSIYHAGEMPFAQLYQPCKGAKIEYSKEWKSFHRQWSRPAAIKAHCENGTNREDYNT